VVPVSQNVAHLAPRNLPWQRLHDHRATITPWPTSSSKGTDYFGNSFRFFSINRAHRRLTVLATSRVSVRRQEIAAAADSFAWEEVRDGLPQDCSPEGLGAYEFVFGSPRIPLLPELRDFALESFAPQRPILEAGLELTARIFGGFAYDSTATTVHTPVIDAFRGRRGVCQDLAHVQIGCLRALGLAARYVSGYICNRHAPGAQQLVGADASHAWLSLYCGRLGWVDLDPTNNVIPQLDHITVAWGRDYDDVCPINGVYVGGGHHQISVAVSVVPLADDAEVAN
jgi:transglutaminase-like putative cysteine protease